MISRTTSPPATADDGPALRRLRLLAQGCLAFSTTRFGLVRYGQLVDRLGQRGPGLLDVALDVVRTALAAATPRPSRLPARSRVLVADRCR